MIILYTRGYVGRVVCLVKKSTRKAENNVMKMNPSRIIAIRRTNE